MRWKVLAILVAVAACSDRTEAPIVPEALSVGLNRPVFIGTSRARDETGTFGIERSDTLQLLHATVSIPPKRSLGSVSDGLGAPQPERDFALARMDPFESQGAFVETLGQEIARSSDGARDVTVFVHGFNNSFSDAAFRMAQLGHDLEIPGAHVTYAWPSRGNPLGYEYDRDSALFARDGLADLLQLIRTANQPDIVLVAHSMGSALVMETLRQLDIARPGWVGRNIRAVVLMSPDINTDVFRSQINQISVVPDPFIVIVSQKDAVLRLSSRLRGEKTQLGNIRNAEAVADLPVTVVDVTAFSDRKSGNHFVAAGSPALIQLIRRSADLDREFLRGRSGATLVLPGSRRVLNEATRIELRPNPADER